MLSLKMKKLFISLVVITVMVLTIGSVSSLATQIKATTSNTKTNNTVKNTNTNSKASGSLPYAGTNTSVVFVVIALVASALYAYKKVSDYNI